jgi:hypothetical protein
MYFSLFSSSIFKEIVIKPKLEKVTVFTFLICKLNLPFLLEILPLFKSVRIATFCIGLEEDAFIILPEITCDCSAKHPKKKREIKSIFLVIFNLIFGECITN